MKTTQKKRRKVDKAIATRNHKIRNEEDLAASPLRAINPRFEEKATGYER